jgi:hypothetical protein
VTQTVDPFGPGTITDPLFGAGSELADLLAAQALGGTPRFGLGPADRFFPFLDRPRAPFQPAAAENLRSLANAYRSPELGRFLGTLRPDVADSLLEYELEAVQRGSDPLTDKERLKVALAAQTGQAVTQLPDRNPLNFAVNAYKDLTDIVASVPRLPVAIAKEIGDLPHIGERIAQAQAEGKNLIEALAGAPGLRLLPGAYTLGNLAGGGEGLTEAVSHPLFSFLDVLPAAKAAGLGERIAATPFGARAGELKAAGLADLKGTRLGQLAQTMWGAGSRKAAIFEHMARTGVAQAMDPTLPAELTAHLDAGIAKEATAWAQKWQDRVPPARARELTDLAEQPDWVSRVSDPAEIELLTDYRRIVERVSQQAVDARMLEQLEIAGQLEYVTPAQARVFLKGRAGLDQFQRFTRLRDAVANPAGPEALAGLWHETIGPFLADPDVPFAVRRRAASGMVHAYRAAGLSIPEGAAETARKLGKRNLGQFIEQFDHHRPTPLTAPLSAGSVNAAQNWLRDHRAYTPRAAAGQARRLERLETNFVPARWKSYLDTEIRRAATDSQRVAVASDIPDELVRAYLAEGRWSEMVRAGLIAGEDLDAWVAGAKETMQALRAAGHEPLFVHRVSPAARGSINFPQPLRGLDRRTVAAIGQVKARTFDSAPYVHDLGVALSHQALEWVNRRAATNFLGEFLRTAPIEGETVAPFARTRAQLTAQYAGAGRARKAFDPALDEAELIDRRINKEWERFDPKSLPPEVARDLGIDRLIDAEIPYLPRPLMRNLRMFIRPPEFHAILDVPMAAFRTSVVALAPRAQLNNVIGGAVVLAARTDPSVWAKFRPAMEMLRTARAGGPLDVPASFRATFGSTTNELLQMNYDAGTRLAELWKQATDRPAPAAGLKAGRGMVRKSLELNGFFDDLYRSMAYLYGTDKAITKGIGKAEAQAAGEALARRTLMSWDQSTPFERTIMRSIFPFYNWCVDEQTEALTRRGWVSGWDLTEDDEILTMDADRRLVWSAVESIYRNPQYDGPMYHLHSPAMDAMVTPGHKFALIDGRLLRVEDLRQRHTLAIMGEALESDESIYTDAFVEVVGWAVTEGHLKKNSAGNVTTVEISQKDGTDGADRIRLALKRCGARWHEYLAGGDRKIRYFGVTGTVAKQIIAVAPAKIMRPEFLISLSTQQRELLIETMITADGHRSWAGPRPVHRPWESFTQKSGAAVDAFTMLCTLAGTPTAVRRNGADGCHLVSLRRQKNQGVRTLHGFVLPRETAGPVSAGRPTIPYRGLVWCPTTATGTWVCRRNGRVHVTGNSSHIIRYAWSYPGDHPFRTAVLATIGRTELEDLGTGLPQTFLNSFFLGHPDKDGHVRAFTLGGMNPFRDVANYMTLNGFLSGVNPVFATILNQVGVEPGRGTNLYPNLRYDPETGRLAATAPNPLVNFLTNTIPQTGILTGLADRSSELQELFRMNPATAMRMLASSAGIPILFRDYELNAEQFKAELRRDEAMSRALSDALRTGNWAAAAEYPQLRPVLGQIQALQDSGNQTYARLNNETLAYVQAQIAATVGSGP